MEQNKQVGVAIITHNAKHHLPHCLPPLLSSPLKPRVVVVNSSSQDGTVEEAQRLGAETLVIPRQEFNHGTTREVARKHLNTDIVVMVTPDAYALNSSVLEILIEPIVDKQASIAYARQIAHDGADFFERFHREFNYPKERQIRSLKDVKKYGIYTFFCSDSFSAYSNQALEEIGGFEEVLLGEDTVAVAKLLHCGHQIAYCADAVVKHSHRYSLKQEFKRHFDTGLARNHYRSLISAGGSDSSRGKDYVRKIFGHLAKEKPWLIPYAILQTFVKWIGYKVGSVSENAPLWFKKLCSSQDFYWTSKESVIKEIPTNNK